MVNLNWVKIKLLNINVIFIKQNSSNITFGGSKLKLFLERNEMIKCIKKVTRQSKLIILKINSIKLKQCFYKSRFIYRKIVRFCLVVYLKDGEFVINLPVDMWLYIIRLNLYIFQKVIGFPFSMQIISRRYYELCKHHFTRIYITLYQKFI